MVAPIPAVLLPAISEGLTYITGWDLGLSDATAAVWHYLAEDGSVAVRYISHAEFFKQD